LEPTALALESGEIVDSICRIEKIGVDFYEFDKNVNARTLLQQIFNCSCVHVRILGWSADSEADN